MNPIDTTVLLWSYVLTMLITYLNYLLNSPRKIFMGTMIVAIGVFILEIVIFSTWGNFLYKELIHRVFFTMYLIIFGVLIIDKVHNIQKEKQ